MKIRFFDKDTNEDAVLGPEATEFFVDADGRVVEFIEQTYADYYIHIIRSDVDFQIINDKS